VGGEGRAMMERGNTNNLTEKGGRKKPRKKVHELGMRSHSNLTLWVASDYLSLGLRK